MDGARNDERFRVLFVCTGNICRSPTAEMLTRHLLVGRLGGREAARVEVGSAGVGAVAGYPMHPLAREQLAPWGLDGARSERFLARQISPAIVEDIDVVLGASPRHRSAVLEEFPELLGVTFSLREFARLAAAVPTGTLPQDLVTRAATVVDQARNLRGRVPAPDDDDIPDPMGGPPEAHARSTTLIFDALRSIMDVIAPRRAAAGAMSRPPQRSPLPMGRPLPPPNPVRYSAER